MKKQLSAVRKQDARCRMQDAGCKSLSCIMYRASGRIPHSALHNEKGIALVMILILSAISLAIMAGLIYMLTSGTQISGMGKRYKTALEAAKGGNDVTQQVKNLKGDPTEIQTFIGLLSNGAVTTPDTCIVANTSDLLPDGITKCSDHVNDCTSWPASYKGLCVKLKMPTYCWSNCDSSLTINPPSSGDNTTYDMRFDLGSYRVYAKIVDTVYGNTSGSPNVDLGSGKGVVDTGTELSNVYIPFLYTIELNSQNLSNPAERAKLSVLLE